MIFEVLTSNISQFKKEKKRKKSVLGVFIKVSANAHSTLRNNAPEFGAIAKVNPTRECNSVYWKSLL